MKRRQISGMICLQAGTTAQPRRERNARGARRVLGDTQYLPGNSRDQAYRSNIAQLGRLPAQMEGQWTEIGDYIAPDVSPSTAT